MGRYNRLIAVMFSSSAFVPAGFAVAQDAAPASQRDTPPASQQDTPPSNILQEIVVTAQRREENLERTPVAVSVVTAASMVKQAVVSEADLQDAVPGLVVHGGGASNQLGYSLRGQTVDAFSSSPPAVLPYIDEVASNPAGASTFYDLQSVQVLKGPQGTLFGRNGTGGAVLFSTTKPSDDYGGYISAKAGDYDLGEVEGAVNLPIVPDKLLLRVAGFYQHEDGYQHNLFNNTTVGDNDRFGTRVSLTFKPTDKLTNDLVVDYSHTNGPGTQAVIYSVYPPGGSVKPLLNTPLLYSPALDAAIGVPGAFATYVSQHPGVDPQGVVAYAALQQARGPYDASLDEPLINHDDNVLLSNITTYDLGGDTQIKNIFGYTRSTAIYTNDTDGTPFGIIETGAVPEVIQNTQFSEELQLLGKTLNDRLTYVTGFYYLNDDINLKDPSSLLDLSPIMLPTLSTTADRSTDVSYAGYAQGTYDLSQLTGVEGLNFTGGLRYTSEDIAESQLPGSRFFGSPALEQSDGKLSWQVGVQEQLNSDLLLYVVSRHSFRAGGINSTAPPVAGTAETGGAEFNPETATDVEVGAKFQGRLAGAPARLNVAVYNQWVDNIQRSIYALPGGRPVGLTVNVPAAEVTGTEVDGQINPTPWLKIGANLAYTDARFTDGRAVLFGVPTVYGPYPDAPSWSGSAFAEATMPLKNELSISLRGDLYGQSNFYFSSLNNTVNPGTNIPGYDLVNFRVSLDDAKTGWSLAAYLKNAFNKVYYVGGQPFGEIVGINTALPGEPRTFFIQASYTF
jgi:iron complex outermembrane receptor protein